jgi:hypothetical protein
VIPEGRNAEDFDFEVGQPGYLDGVQLGIWNTPLEL